MISPSEFCLSSTTLNALYNTVPIYLSPVTCHKCCMWPGFRGLDEGAKRALLAGPHWAVCSGCSACLGWHVELLHFCSETCHSCHSSLLLNVKMIFSFLTLRINLASLHVLLVHLSSQLCKLRPLFSDHDSHQKDVFMLSPLLLSLERIAHRRYLINLHWVELN